jgi:hemolysin activation/secretion protein
MRSVGKRVGARCSMWLAVWLLCLLAVWPAESWSQAAISTNKSQAQPDVDLPAAPRFVVQRFQIEGATLVPLADLQAALKPWLNKPITLLHLQHAARVMAEVYQAQGWPVRPQVPAQDVHSGVVTLVVDESRVADAAARLTDRLTDRLTEQFTEPFTLQQPAQPVPTPQTGPALLKTAGPAPAPDAGSLLREQRRNPPVPPPPPLPNQPVPVRGDGVAVPAVAAPAAAPATGPQFEVRAFRIQGATQLAEADVQAVLAPLLHRALVFADLQDGARSVAELYRKQGWLARAQWPAQDLLDGVLTLQVVEARLGQVRLDSTSEANAEITQHFDRGRLVALVNARQASGQPLNLHNVDRALHVINNTPGVRAAAVLAPGDAAGLTDIVIQTQDQPLLSGHLAVDNHGSRAAGQARSSASVALSSPSRRGDELVLSSQATSPGNHTHHLQVSLPWGVDGLSLGAQASALRYRLRGEFAAAQGEGSASTWGLKARYPLTPDLGLQVAAERRHYQNRAGGLSVSDKTLTSLTATLNGDWTAIQNKLRRAREGGDTQAHPTNAGLTSAGAAAATPWSISLMQGQVNLQANPDNQAADAAGPRTAGGSTRLAWSLAHLQPLGASNTLVISANGQWAASNLDSADKFSLGGPHGVRAYPSLEGSGDTGWLANLEWRHSSQPGLQWVAFYDLGQVHINRLADFAAAPAKNTVRLQGAGVGLNWQPSAHYSLRGVVARRLGANPQAQPVDASNPANNPSRNSDGSLSATRAWLSLTALF